MELRKSVHLYKREEVNCQSVGTVNFAFLFTTSATISISILQMFTSYPVFASLWRFISQLIWIARTCTSYECFILKAVRLSNKLLGQGYVKERLKSSLRKLFGRHGGLIKRYEVPPLSNVTQNSGWWPYMQWHPPLISHYTNFWPCYWSGPFTNLIFDLIARGFHRTSALGAAYQQRTLTPPDTRFCPDWDLHVF